MTKFVVLLSLCIAACDVGDASNGQTVGDAGKKDGMGSGSADAGLVQAHVHQTANQIPAGNTSNAGQGCMSVNCHNSATPGPGATVYAFAGTVFTTQNGSTGAPGVTVHAGGMTAVTDTAGNFYVAGTPISSGNADVTTATMAATLSTGGGNCNSSGCHQQPGGSQGGIYK